MGRSIAFVIIGLGFGGAEVQVVELAGALKRRGWSPTIVAITPPLGLEKRADELGIPYCDLGLPLRSKSPLLVLRLVRTLRRLRPDLVHSHTLPPNFATRLARLFTRLPVVVTTAHSTIEGGRAKMAFYRLTDRLTDLTTNVSPQAVERFRQVHAAPAGRIRFVPNGIDVTRFAPDPARREAARRSLGAAPDEFLWLAVGRHCLPKDYPNLLAAVRALPDHGAWRLLVAGDGPLFDEHQALVSSLGLGDRVQLLGLRTDVRDLMNAADGYVMSSAWEGLPIVLLEAAASGLPVVATDVGGNREIVRAPEGGWLVPAKDPTALAAAMSAVQGMPTDARHRMGEVGRARVTGTFGMDAVVDQWEALYGELLAKRAR